MSAADVRTGRRVAVSAALNDIEDARPEAAARARALLAELESTGASARGHRVGFTGPPGAGKSTLVAAYAQALRASSPPRSVGVLAVDPSSRRSGGALLGDRVRIAVGTDGDPGLFIRSLASRGELGGLAPAVADELVVLASAFDVALVETVGVGQSETEVREVVDTLVFVVQPGAGDTLQHLKAGVMEVPDLFVVSKADSGAPADRTRRELALAVEALVEAGILPSPLPVLATSARERLGIDALVAAVDRHRSQGEASGRLAKQRRDAAVARAARLFARRYGEVGVERAGGEAAVREALASAIESGEGVTSAVAARSPWRA